MTPSKPFNQMTQQERDNFIAASNAFYKEQNELSAPKPDVKPNIGLDPYSEPMPMPTPKPVSPRLAQQQARQAHLNELRAIHAQRRAARDAKRALRNAPMQPKAPFSPYDGDDRFTTDLGRPEDFFGSISGVGDLNSKSNLDKMKAIMDEIARVKNQPQVQPVYEPDYTNPVPNKPNYIEPLDWQMQMPTPDFTNPMPRTDDAGAEPNFKFNQPMIPSVLPQAPTGTGNAPYNPYASMGGGMNPPMGGIGSLSGGIGGLGGNYQNNASGVMPAQNNMLGQSTNTPVKPPNPMGMKKGGAVKKFAKGGAIKKSKSSKPMVSNASKRGDGIAQRGKTKGRIV